MKLATLLLTLATPFLEPPHIARKKRAVDKRIPFPTTALPVLLILVVIHYFSFLSILSLKNESTPSELRESPNGVPRSLETSSGPAH
jgi:hypothetical protein